MAKKYDVQKAHLTQQAADELIGYLYLLIDYLLEKYCDEVLDEELGESQIEESVDDNDEIQF